MAQQHVSTEGLKGIRVAVLASDGFEQMELDQPVSELQQAGVVVHVLAMEARQVSNGIQGMKFFEPIRLYQPDQIVSDVSPDDYQALLIPGGALSVDQMRESRYHLGIVRNFMDAGKPIGAIGHGAWLLGDAGVLVNRTLTSWPAIRKDLEHAGGVWKDRDVVVDGNLITCRKTADLVHFSRVFLSMLAQSAGQQKRAA